MHVKDLRHMIDGSIKVTPEGLCGQDGVHCGLKPGVPDPIEKNPYLAVHWDLLPSISKVLNSPVKDFTIFFKREIPGLPVKVRT